MSLTPQVVFLAWQCHGTRAIIPVGRLLERARDDYEFVYIGAVRRAETHGFQPLVSFPRLDVVYRSAELPPLFHNRVMRPARPDYPAFVSELGLQPDASPLSLMARSGGRRQTDELEVFAAPEVDADGVLRTSVLLRGVRHVAHAEEAVAQLSTGSRLFVMADMQNEQGEHALALRTQQQQFIGYLPDYLARELAQRDPSLTRQLLVTVEKVNLPPATVHHRLLCRIAFPAELHLFQSDDYRPLASGSEVAA
ncbi:MAG TPA: hypothetical protein VLC09_01590 [Polyangiaceae bacterium]|nr:hypothetical protein [Polyangiaceae bacterium]